MSMINPRSPKTRISYLLTAVVSLAANSVSAGIEPDQAEALSEYVWDEFQELCLSNTIEDAGHVLESEETYERYGDSDVEGEVWVEDMNLPQEYDARITIRAGVNRCQIATWDDVDPLFRPLLERLAGNMPTILTSFKDQEGNVVREHSYRFVVKQDIQFGEVIQITLFDDGGVTLGRYDRSGDGVRVYDSRAEWTTETERFEGVGELPVAAANVATHQVRLYDMGGEYILRFDPNFYPFFGEERRYYMRQSDVVIDGDQLHAYGECVESGENCNKNGDWLELELDRESVQQIRSGEVLTFFAETTNEELMQVRFPLAGVGDVLDRIADNDRVSTLANMREHGDLEEQGRLMRAVSEGDMEEVRTLIEGGADPDILVGVDELPLVVLAGAQGRIEIAQYLISEGADIDRGFADHGAVETSDPEMTSALHHAVRYREGPERTRLWLRLGADTEARNDAGRTPLMMVRHYQDNLEKFEALKEAGADIHARDNEGHTAMHSFVWRKGTHQVDELRWLHHNGLSLDVQNDDGDTPLMLAIRYRNLSEAEWLVNEGADPWITNDEGQNAVDQAIETRRDVDETDLLGRERKEELKRRLQSLIDHLRRRQ